MKTRRDFVKAGLILGAGLPLAGFEQTVAAAADGFVALPLPAQNAPDIIHTFDARPLQNLDLGLAANAATTWDTIHVLAALQGLANREVPRFYLFYCHAFDVDTDQFWFDWLRHEDGWLKKTRIRRIRHVHNAISVFRDAFDGLVVYDPAVPATSNLASTAAGVERLLPVRFDSTSTSVFTLLTRELKLPVRLWLINPDGTSKFTGSGTLPDYGLPSSGSAKVDAYRWAAARWLKTGACAPGVAAYYVDAWWLKHPLNAGPDMHTLSNHDWFVARRGFFFDLSPWADEKPVDDPHQPLGADKACLAGVLRDLYDCAGGGMIKIGGFPPWPFKYTTWRSAGKHDGVPTEWEFIRFISQFNGYAEADAAGLGAMANASFFQHYPLREHYPQPNPKPSPADWKSQGFVDGEGHPAKKLFVGHYVGDYDSPSWLYKAVPKFFRDPQRGSVPLGWAFDPNNADRAPHALAYAYRHATPSDFFIAGDSGAGYLNPRGLIERPDSQLPGALKKWQDYCRGYFDRWGMTITGFILEGASGASLPAEFAAYGVFSPDGLGTQFEPGAAIVAGMPICPEHDLPDSPDDAAKMIAKLAAANSGQTGFLWARATLKSPEWYAQISETLRSQYPGLAIQIVDPYTFFGLIRLAKP